MATLFPDAAIRVSRPAEPFICVLMLENVSVYCARVPWLVEPREDERGFRRSGATYGVGDEALRAGLVVNVDGHAAEGGDLVGELIQAGVVLALALEGLRHDGRCRGRWDVATRFGDQIGQGGLSGIRRA